MPHRTSGPNRTQQRILDAGFRLWLDEPPSVLFGGFNVARLAKAAGVTRATFYSYWPSADAYIEDLLDHLTSRDPDGYRPGAARAVAELGTGGPDIAQRFLDACALQLETTIEDPALRLRLGFLSQMDDPGVAEKLRDRYRTVEARTEEIYLSIRNSWGREARPPITEVNIQAVFSALIEGLAARHRIDPEAVPIELYGWVSLMLLMVITRRIDDRRDVAELLSSVNAWPAIGQRLLADREVERTTELPTRIEAATARQVVLESRRLLANLSWQDLTLVDIGLAMGLPDDALLRAFGSKAGLAMAIFKLNIAERISLLAADRDPITHLRDLVAVAVDELRRSPALTQNVVVLFAGGARSVEPGLIDWDPIPSYVEAVRAAQEAGQLRGDLDPAVFTGTLLRVILTENAPPAVPPWSGADAVDLLLLGAGAPPVAADDDPAP